MTVVYVILGILAIYILICLLLIISGIRESKDIPKGTVGIVLGCPVIDNEPCNMLKQRCDRAKKYLEENSDLITCVLFLGGDDDKQKNDLINCLEYIRLNYPQLKTALYSGFNQVPENIINLLDYVKIGPYIKERGGLNNPNTNQRLYKIENGHLNDITNIFWKKPYS